MRKSKAPRDPSGGWLLLMPMKRLTIDVPAELHWRFRTGCTARGVKMAAMLREMMEERFPVAKRKRKRIAK
jgi:hypothetical protein